jgi:hypothetical protein
LDAAIYLRVLSFGEREASRPVMQCRVASANRLSFTTDFAAFVVQGVSSSSGLAFGV